MQVGDIMHTDVVTVGSDDTFAAAAAVLREHRISSVIVEGEAGPAGIVNSQGLKVSHITRDTPNPAAGMVVKDPKTGEPTGMLRNAYGESSGSQEASWNSLSAMCTSTGWVTFMLCSLPGTT